MNLNQIAENDLAVTLEDSENGFGVNIVFKSNGKSYPVTLKTNNIGLLIDIASGTAARGRQVECDGRISTIETLAGDLPSKNWSCNFIDTNGKSWSCAVVDCIPDKKLGIYKVILEALNKNARL